MNIKLAHTPFPASSYNLLPHIDSMDKSAEKNAAALKDLLIVIFKYNLQHVVSIHLVHKHYDLPDGHVMVYETVRGDHHPDFILSSPRLPSKCKDLRGLYFKVIGKHLVAYEFTTDIGPEISQETEFLQEFHEVVTKHAAQDVFALTIKAPETKRLTELEMSDLNSTILAEIFSSIPVQKDYGNTITDWASSDIVHDKSVPGIIQLSCMKTRQGTHYDNGLNCRKTRSGKHTDTTTLRESAWEISLDGTDLDPSSEVYKVISRARSLVDVA